MDLHQLRQGLGPVDGVEIGFDGVDSGGVPGIPVENGLIEILDFRLGRPGLGIPGGNLTDKAGDLLRDLIVQLIEGAGVGVSRREFGGIQPLFIDGGIKVILEIGPLQGVDPADEQVQLLLCYGTLGGESGVAGTGHNPGLEHIFQRLFRPIGHVGELTGQGNAFAVAHRLRQLAKGVGEHDQQFHTGDGTVQVEIAVLVALEYVLCCDAGVIVVRSGQEEVAGLAASEGGVLRRKGGGQQRQEHDGGEQSCQQAFRFFHLSFFLS